MKEGADAQARVSLMEEDVLWVHSVGVHSRGVLWTADVDADGDLQQQERPANHFATSRSVVVNINWTAEGKCGITFFVKSTLRKEGREGSQSVLRCDL